MSHAIETKGLRKVYETSVPSPENRKKRLKQSVVALHGLDLAIEQGEIFGLLGPNGAGKTTAIGMLTTRVVPTDGTAIVAGADVTSNPIGVRRAIGVVQQRPNPDRSLSVLENLVYHATYFGFPRATAIERAEELLRQFEIPDKRDEKIDALSGGQLQRLMLARAMIHDPEILFLDEPTVGLDPQVRLDLWDILRDLHSRGRTIVITTHYMEEADQLCDRVAILDHGSLLVTDTPTRLRAKAPGGTLIELKLDGPASETGADAGAIAGVIRAETENHTLRAYSERGGEIIPSLIAAAERRSRQVVDIHLMKPSLETLFIHLTGRKLQ